MLVSMLVISVLIRIVNIKELSLMWFSIIPLSKNRAVLDVKMTSVKLDDCVTLGGEVYKLSWSWVETRDI